MSPESTVDYYKRINAGVREALGGFHSCPMLAYSANLHEVFHWFQTEDDGALAELLVDRAIGLQEAGADLMMIACNTAHKVAPQIASALTIPLIHIADVLGEALSEAGHTRVGLLGSSITMNAPFYRERLWDRFGVEAISPEGSAAMEVDRIIKEELCFHQLREESRQSLEDTSGALGMRGAQAIVLACTELGLLLAGETVADLPLFDTTRLHTERAVALALGRQALPEAARAA